MTKFLRITVYELQDTTKNDASSVKHDNQVNFNRTVALKSVRYLNLDNIVSLEENNQPLNLRDFPNLFAKSSIHLSNREILYSVDAVDEILKKLTRS